MAANYSSQHQQLISAFVAAAPQKLSAEQRNFITLFYSPAPLADLLALEPVHAVTMALAAWEQLQNRAPGTPLISITAKRIELPDQRPLSRTEIIAINNDRPFLVDSLSSLLNALGLTIYRMHHPIFTITRDADHHLKTIDALAGKKTGTHESLIYFEVSPIATPLTAEIVQQKMLEVLAQVTLAVDDWSAMNQLVRERAADLLANSKADAEAKEIHDLLHWLSDNHFVFLGVADYDAQKGDMLAFNKACALGIYKLAEEDGAIEFSLQPTSKDRIAIFKASSVSQVHRRITMDYIVLRRFDAKGNFIGEFRLLGLFTSAVYWRETGAIPFLRRKTAQVLERAQFDPHSHAGKNLKTALEFLPRDELFQMDEDTLFNVAMGILSLESRPQVRLFIRADAFERFISAMVYVPRERFSTGLREKIVALLEQAYHGTFVTFYTQVSDSPLARVMIVIATTPGATAQVDEAALETTISELANNWPVALRDAIITRSTSDNGESVAHHFMHAFPLSYMNNYTSLQAAKDVACVRECLEGDGLALELFHAPDAPENQLTLKCFTRDLNAELSSILPLLEHMGAVVVDATPYIITPVAPLPHVLLRVFTLRIANHTPLELATSKARVEEAIGSIWRGLSDNDPFNALVMVAGLSTREVLILRSYSRYLQQINFPYSQAAMASALIAHPTLASALVQLFHTRFALEMLDREQAGAEIQAHIEAGLEAVTNLAEDRIIRQILALILASLRTNYYQTLPDGASKPYLSIKMRSAAIPDMPLPVPFAEIFVTSMRVEGIHLRGGSVARGGLRWSDRPEDFRSEVLGLVKAQMVKNAVIVPQGAKGGFILRKAPSERAALMEEGIACYKIFLRGLLDITDNLVNNEIVPPAQTTRLDGDDPYLVVAADKGTATFSDYANALAAEYGFWLGDAFASGGSVGYDHKVMAITARGGWVSVMRHFREMGRDSQTEDFTCAGIGDMSGDVFGNGMLLSEHTQLVAAFNHRHIFLDPNPDAKASFKERQRLFALPRSGWNDYNAKLISKGGGIFERTEKTIKLSAEIRAALGTDLTHATPDELIRTILKAPVDLLWNGGIGTYVKAASESHEQVGDRTNASLRINGAELRCKVVGEGGNLGFTQRGRIEYARSGGRINTDAIDNSGGVDCSDHEVNIKIALGNAVESGAITLEQRNILLKEMTDEVANLVLIDNKLQTQAISIAQAQGPALLDPAEQLVIQLEAEKFLNRQVEFLPEAKQFAELRAGKLGLTRPELAVLMAYAKMALSRDLKASVALDTDYFKHDLLRYFPKAMQDKFADNILHHPLKREIVATMITNSIVNRTGFAFAHGLMRATGLGASPLAIAYIATRDAFKLREIWKEIEALDAGVPAATVAKLFGRINGFIAHSCRWFLTQLPQPMAIDEVMARYAAPIATLTDLAESLMTETLRKAYDKCTAEFVEQGVPEHLAGRIAKLEVLSSACDMIDIANLLHRPLEEVGRNYFELGATLKLGWLRRSARSLSTDTEWQQQAVQSLIGSLYQTQRQLTLDVLGRDASETAAQHWAASRAESLHRFEEFIQHLRAQPSMDSPMLIVALQQVQQVMLARDEIAA